MFCLPKHQVHIQIGDVWLRPAIYPWISKLAFELDNPNNLIVDPEQASFLTWDTFHPNRANIFLNHRFAGTGWKEGTVSAQYVVEVNGRAVGDTSTHLDVGADGEIITATGSWLFKKEQGKGYGTALRCGMLAMLQEFGYAKAKSGWNIDNIASRSVSLKLGYTPTKLEGEDLRTQSAEVDLLQWESPLPVRLWVDMQSEETCILTPLDTADDNQYRRVKDAFQNHAPQPRP